MRLKIITMLVMLFAATCVQAQISNRPLYVDDDSGWKLWSCYSAETIMQRYSIPGSTAYKYMKKSGTSKFYGFSVVVPEGDQVFFSHKSRIVMTYDIDNVVYETISEELFVINQGNRAGAVFSKQGIFVPSPHYDAFTTKMLPEVGNTVLFARFPLTHQPDFIIKCVVEAALYKPHVEQWEGGER